MAIKITVILFNTRGPFHWACQHVGAEITDLETGRTSSIEFGLKKSLEIYPSKTENPLQGWNACCVGKTDLFSNKDFDKFIVTVPPCAFRIASLLYIELLETCVYYAALQKSTN